MFHLMSTRRTSLVAQTVKGLSTMWETRVQSLGWEDPLEKEMAIHSSTIAWKIPWTEEPGRIQSMGSQRVRHNWMTELNLTDRKHCTICLYVWVQSCPTLWDPTMDCRPPGFSVHGIFQAIILDWVAISFSKGSSWSRDQTLISCISCTGKQILYHGATKEARRAFTTAPLPQCLHPCHLSLLFDLLRPLFELKKNLKR